MIDNTSPPPKLLMAEGRWLVPVHERPDGWERYGIEEPGPDLTPNPTPEQVASVVGDIAERAAIIVAPDEEPAVKVRKPHRRSSHRKSFDEISKMIDASAAEFGADEILKTTAKVMVAGMWTDSPGTLKRWCGLEETLVQIAKDRFLSSGIWSKAEDGAILVHCGDEVEQYHDMGFWLNAMVGTGEINAVMGESGMMYSAATPMTREL